MGRVGGDLEAGIIRCLDREIGTRVGGGKSGRGEGDEDQCVREQWSSRRQVVKRLEPGGRHQRLAPDIGTRRTAPDIGTRRSAPDIGNRRLAPEIGTRRSAPEIGTRDRHQRSAPGEEKCSPCAFSSLSSSPLLPWLLLTSQVTSSHLSPFPITSVSPIVQHPTLYYYALADK